jgi:H+/Cl- antiporter ClcA
VKRAAGDLAKEGPRRVGLLVLLVGGGLTIGLIAQVADWLGASSQDVLFSGQSAVPTIAATDSTKILLILLVAKALGYGLSLGCGFRGGPVFPAIFLGAPSPRSPIRGSTSRRRSPSRPGRPREWPPAPGC